MSDPSDEQDVARYPRTILATCCVPWNADDSLAEETFRNSIRWQLSNGFRNLYVFGTAGEGYAVNEPQFDEVVAVFQDELDQHAAEPMVGLISLSLSTVISRIERCRDRGIRDFQLSLPSWHPLTDAEFLTFFAETCGRFPDCRFLHYNLPRAGRTLTPNDYALLADKHPNLVATKNAGATNTAIAGFLAKAPQLRHFPTEGGYPYGALIGPVGFLVSVASISARHTHALFEAGVRRDVATLAHLSRELGAIHDDLMRTIGPAHIDGAFDKVFCKAHDPRFPLRLLPPYQGATDESFAAFIHAVRGRFPDWLEDEPHLADL